MLAWRGGSRRKIILAKRNVTLGNAIENRIPSKKIKKRTVVHQKHPSGEGTKKRGVENGPNPTTPSPARKFRKTKMVPLTDEMSLDVATITLAVTKRDRCPSKSAAKTDGCTRKAADEKEGENDVPCC